MQGWSKNTDYILDPFSAEVMNFQYFIDVLFGNNKSCNTSEITSTCA